MYLNLYLKAYNGKKKFNLWILLDVSPILFNDDPPCTTLPQRKTSIGWTTRVGWYGMMPIYWRTIYGNSTLKGYTVHLAANPNAPLLLGHNLRFCPDDIGGVEKNLLFESTWTRLGLFNVDT